MSSPVTTTTATTTATSTPLADNAPPDWHAIAADVRCPLCDYSLRGLVDPRCPECGYAFAWPDLLDPNRRRHPCLFEHHPRHNAWSLARTLLGGLRPRRFWGGLNPAMPSRPWRLTVYAILVTLLLISVPLASFVRHYATTVRSGVNRREFMRANLENYLNHPNVKQAITRHGSVQAWIDFNSPPPYSRRYVVEAYKSFKYSAADLATMTVMVAWPWLTLASLMIFRWSMRRARVKTGHVVRCVVYGFDWGFWFVPAFLLVVSPWFAARVIGLLADTSLPMLACAAFAAYGTFRLGSAYSRYLQFDHPYATALASQLIVTAVSVSLLLVFH